MLRSPSMVLPSLVVEITSHKWHCNYRLVNSVSILAVIPIFQRLQQDHYDYWLKGFKTVGLIVDDDITDTRNILTHVMRCMRDCKWKLLNLEFWILNIHWRVYLMQTYLDISACNVTCYKNNSHWIHHNPKHGISTNPFRLVKSELIEI